MAFENLSAALEVQAEACVGFGAPFTAALARAIKADVEAGGDSLALFEPWREARTRVLFNEAVTLRLFAALHDLVLSGDAPGVAAHYPVDGECGDGAAAWAAAVPLLAPFHDRMAGFMTHEPQTNEVGRSLALLGGFLTLSDLTGGAPLRCFEIGASAGLNQIWDRFHYRFGGAEWGETNSPVSIYGDWTGPLSPLSAPISVISRAACDRRPVRIADPVQARRLQAYVWPDMKGRLPRLQAAIGMALAAGVDVEEADAVDWAERMAAPQAGAVTVLYHSIFWQYMPAESQAALTAVIATHGANATAQAPFAWLRLEPDMDKLMNIQVRLTLWPGGQERVLAQSHPHAAWVNWNG